MKEFELRRTAWDIDQYYYLSKEDSRMLDSLMGSPDPKDEIICDLILDKGRACHATHVAERY